MSEHKTITGKLKEITIENFTLIETLRLFLNISNISYDEEDDELVIQLFVDNFNNYIINDNRLYQVLEKNWIEGDVASAIKDESEGTIEFVLSYYNGGSSFEEAISTAIDEMEASK